MIDFRCLRRQTEPRAILNPPSLAVDIFFESRNTDPVEAGKAENMRDHRAVWIDRTFLELKPDTWQAG